MKNKRFPPYQNEIVIINQCQRC